MQRTKLLQSETTLVVEHSEAELKAYMCDGHVAGMPPRVSTLTTEVANGQEAECVKHGSIVLRSGTVLALREDKLLGVKPIGGRDTDHYAIDTVTGELHGFMPKPPCKKTMQNSSELAESHRFLTVTDEAISVTAQTEMHAFKDAITPERKRNLPLPKPMSPDDFVALMTSSPTFATTDRFWYGGCARLEKGRNPNQLEPTSRRPIRSYRPNCNLYSLKDNTVGPVTLASGYGSNTFPYSAAHVLDPSMMSNSTPVVTDTRKCEPNASDTSSVPSIIEIIPPISTCFTGVLLVLFVFTTISGGF